MVWFSARSRRVRLTTGRRPTSASRFRPQVDGLEERLPPGDLLLARVLAPDWLSAQSAVAVGGSRPVTTAAQAAPWNGPPALVASTAAAARSQSQDDLRAHQGGRGQISVALQAPAADALPDPLGRSDFPADLGDAPPAAPARQRLASAGTAGISRTDEAAGPAVSAPSAAPPVDAGQPNAVPTTSRNLALAVSPNDLVANALPVAAGLLPIPAAAADAAGPGAPPRAGVHVLFQLDTTRGGPFPSDRFTVADHTQNTDRRVNLPLPDCSVYVSDCQDIAVLNELDGFNLQPRLSVPFDGPIDVNSVNSRTMFLVSLGDTLNRHDHGGQVVGINQVVWDTFTNTLHVESDQLLDQHTRYALIVTDGIRDQHGRPVQASRDFQRFHRDLSHSRDPVLRLYGQELDEAVRAARRAGVRERDLVDASVFTTESATAILEKIRDQIHAATPEPADFNLGPKGERTVFNLDDVKGIHWEQQTGDNPPSFTPFEVELPLMRLIPGAIGQVAFGKYLSPDYELHPDQFIPAVPTRTGTPVVQGENEIYFNLVLPAGPKPAGGWPVAIFGHGLPADKNLSTSPRKWGNNLKRPGLAAIRTWP